MKNVESIPVSLIIDGAFKNAVIPINLVSELALKLREEGVCAVHFANESVACEGVVILAKGSNHSLMVMPNANEK